MISDIGPVRITSSNVRQPKAPAAHGLSFRGGFVQSHHPSQGWHRSRRKLFTQGVFVINVYGFTTHHNISKDSHTQESDAAVASSMLGLNMEGMVRSNPGIRGKKELRTALISITQKLLGGRVHRTVHCTLDSARGA